MLSRVEMELRSKQQAYNILKTNLQNMEKKANGSLLMRNLNQVIFKSRLCKHITVLLKNFIHRKTYIYKK